MSGEGDALGTGPCKGCGETNHTAHNVSICAACLSATRKHYQFRTCRTFACTRLAERCEECSEERAVQQRVTSGVRVSFTPFEAAMVLCVLAVAKAGDSRYDTAAEPLRRRAIEAAYVRLSSEMGLPEALTQARGDA